MKLKPVGTSLVGSASIKPLADNIRAANAARKAAKTPDGSVQAAETNVKPAARTGSVPGPLSSADAARLNDARRMEHNPFMPGDSPINASGRLREGFSTKDFAKGTNTMRVSQDPLEAKPRPANVQSASNSPTGMHAAFDRIKSNPGTERQRVFEAESYVKKELKSETEIQQFVDILKADLATKPIATNSDFQRGVGQAKRALVTDGALNATKAGLQACKNFADFSAYKSTLSRGAVLSPEQDLKVKQAVAERASQLSDELVAKISGTKSPDKFFSLIKTEFKPFSSKSSKEVKEAFQKLLGPDQGDAIMSALNIAATKHNSTISLPQLTDSLISTISKSDYSNHILAQIKRQASPSEWKQIKSMLKEKGVESVSDQVLDHVISINVPKGTNIDQYRHASVLPSGGFADAMMSGRNSILRPLVRPQGRFVTASPAKIMEDPVKYLKQAFPELTSEQVLNIFKVPGSKYPSGDVPLMESARIPGGLIREVVNSAGKISTTGSLKKVFGVDAAGNNIHVGYELDPKRMRNIPVKRDGSVEPAFLFRGDSRSPSSFKNKDMLAVGKNLDPYDHVHSNGDLGDSGYVATTENLTVAMGYGAPLNSAPNHYVYVLRNTGSISKDFSISGSFEGQFEHLIPGGVKNKNIVGYFKVTGTAEDGNINYSKFTRMP